ncbi:phospholipase D family protein [bacterium]|nr:phospholipase D family protein [bacterium]
MAYRARARTTLGVLTQLVSQAQQSLVIAAPFLQSSETLDRGPLAEALHAALRRGVAVDMVSIGSSLRSLDISDIPMIGNGQLRFFQPLTNVEDKRRLGSHAKFCIADGKDAYIGSANLTGAGLSGNLEMGLLVRGEVARQIEQFWQHLLEIGFFVETSVAE